MSHPLKFFGILEYQKRLFIVNVEGKMQRTFQSTVPNPLIHIQLALRDTHNKDITFSFRLDLSLESFVLHFLLGLFATIR